MRLPSSCARRVGARHAAIIWHKKHSLPKPVTDRGRCQHEQLPTDYCRLTARRTGDHRELARVLSDACACGAATARAGIGRNAADAA
jgi:hypothetical protein